MFLNRWITPKNRYVFVARSAYAGCLMKFLLSPSNISCSRVNTFTFQGEPSRITRTLNPTSTKSSICFLISHFNHSPVISILGRARVAIEIHFFKETITKTAVSLDKFLSPSRPTKSPLWYCTDVCKNISSTVKTKSLETSCFSRSNLETFTESTSTDVNFLKTLSDSSRKWLLFQKKLIRLT